MHEVNGDLVSTTSSSASFSGCPERALAAYAPHCLRRYRQDYLFSTEHPMHPKINKTVCCISSPEASLRHCADADMDYDFQPRSCSTSIEYAAQLGCSSERDFQPLSPGPGCPSTRLGPLHAGSCKDVCWPPRVLPSGGTFTPLGS